MNYLDRNEFNYAPSQEVVEALKNFDINKLCFYTRIYDEGKKSILSVYLSESYGIDDAIYFRSPFLPDGSLRRWSGLSVFQTSRCRSR